MTLTDWRASGWLVDHKPTPQEIRDLFAVAERDLKDSSVTQISTDTQLALAYNAVLQIAAAALAASGYRASRDRKHYLTLQSLVHTIGADSKLVVRLDAFSQEAQHRRLREGRIGHGEGGRGTARLGEEPRRAGDGLDAENALPFAADGVRPWRPASLTVFVALWVITQLRLRVA